MDTWCGPIGSASLVVIIAFMSQELTLNNSDEECRSWATEYLEHVWFLYAKSNFEDPKVI